jgi:hypothetical protein
LHPEKAQKCNRRFSKIGLDDGIKSSSIRKRSGCKEADYNTPDIQAKISL